MSILTQARPAAGTGTALSMHANSAALILNVFVSAGLGQLSWLLAARLFSPAEVGVASAIITGTLLCGQLALLGFGSAAISLLVEHRHKPNEFLRTLFTTVALAGLIAGGVYLLVIGMGFREFETFAEEPWHALVVLLTAGLMPIALLVDQTSIALRRADGVLVRSLAGGIVRLLILVLLGLMTIAGMLHSLAMLIAWLSTVLVPCLLGNAQLRRALPGFSFRPSFAPDVARSALGLGLPNHLLSMALQAPGLVLPTLVAQLLSPATNAYWYMAWMLAGLTFVIPASLGTSLFAEAANRPGALGAGIGGSIRASLAVGLIAAITLAVAANWLLGLLGAGYASEAITPLRILVLGVCPLAFTETYVGTCRARRSLAEPTLVYTLAGMAILLGAILAAPDFGLTGVAVTWLSAQTATGAWAAWRLHNLVSSGEPLRRR